MEVETQSLSNFDIVSSKSPFFYAAAVSDCRTIEAVGFDDGNKRSEEGLKSSVDRVAGAESPAEGDRKCDDSDSVHDVVMNPEAEVETDVNVAAETSLESCYAVKLQKMYRGHRTRRRLADSVVVAEELWWQALDYARLNQSTVSFFNFSKPETPLSRWNRVSLNASKVGKGLSKDAQAQKLAFQHWIEAIDPQHRYGHSLHLYFEEWVKSDAGQPFFYWLDIGEGKETDLKECPRSKLRQQCIKYLGPQEREHYEYIVFEGQIVHKLTGDPLDTNEGSKGAKWIFVMSTFEKLYAGEKKKGIFQHSSFLAGGATLAAGRFIVEQGVLKSISPYSGHYRPTEEMLNSFLSILSHRGVDLSEVQIHKANEDYNNYADDKSDVASTKVQISTKKQSHKSDGIPHEEKDLSLESVEETKTATKTKYERTLSGGLQSPRAEVSKKAILERINSKKEAKSYQLGHQLSLKWSTGFGPRIGCVADYPLEVRLQALEFVNLSPRSPPSQTIYRSVADPALPTADHARAPDNSNGDGSNS